MMAKCVKCGACDDRKDSHTCQSCGTELTPNHCSSPDCEKHINLDLPDDAEFCPLCGIETYYTLNNILNPRIR
jgi:hypothetical protein